MNPIHANEAQLRAIGVRLTLLDEAICQIEQFVQGRQIKSVFVGETNTLTPSQRIALGVEISAIRDMLRQLRADLHFIVSPRDAADIVQGECNGQWEPLSELNGRYLRAYGAVAEGLAEYLDPKADEVLRRLQRMAAICADSRHVAAPRGEQEH